MRWLTILAVVLWLSSLAAPALGLLEVASFDVPARSRDLQVHGDLAFVLGDDLRIYDVSDPSAVVEIGSSPVPGFAFTVVGTLAYVAATTGLVIVDVSDPGAPVRVGEVATARSGPGIAVSGSRAYMTMFSSVLIFDVSDPALPEEIGVIDPGAQIDTLEAVGDIVTLGAFSGSGGLIVVDASDPANPIEVGRSLELGGVPADVELAGHLAYVSTRIGEIGVFDLSDPAAPLLLGETELVGRRPLGGLTLGSAYAFVAVGASGKGLHAVDVSNPAAPRPAGELAPLSSLGGQKVSLSRGLAYLLVASSRTSVPGIVQIVDPSVPETPAVLGRLDTFAGNASRIVVEDGLAYVSRDRGELLLIDVSDPTAPTTLGSLVLEDRNQTLRAMDAAEGLAYLTVGNPVTGPGTLWVVDASDPTSPTGIGSLDLGPGSTPSDLQVVGDSVYLTDFRPGSVRVIDVSDPSAPAEISSIAVDGGLALHVQDELVYVGRSATSGPRENELVIIDASDPMQLDEIGRLSLGDDSVPNGIDTSDGLAYVATTGGLHVVDVSDPGSPVPLGRIEGTFPRDVLVAGTRAYLASFANAFVVDVSDPNDPVLLGGAGTGSDLDVSGDLVYGSGSIRLEIIDFGPEFAPNAPPLADAGPDRLVECAGPSGTPVTLDGRGSSDPDGDPLGFTWTDSFGTAQGPTPTVSLAPGEHAVALEVADPLGAAATDEVSIRVEDTVPPHAQAALVRVRGRPSEGRGGLRFRAELDCADVCDPSPAVTAEFEGEPVADGQVVVLRGAGSPFETRLHLECHDAAGNLAEAEAAPRVPGRGRPGGRR